MFKKRKKKSQKETSASKIILPEIKDWQLFFKKEYGTENRASVLKAFFDFVVDAKSPDVAVPGHCMIAGKVYGHDSYEDGEEVITSCIKTIFRIDRSIMQCQEDYPEEDNLFLIGFTTHTGKMYYVDYRKKNQFMTKLENDHLINRKLSEEAGFYTPDHLKNHEFL